MTRNLRWDLVLRSLFIQASWNYRNLLGTGLAWALRHGGTSPGKETPSEASPPGSQGSAPLSQGSDSRSEPPASNSGESDTGWNFNAHPYLAGVAIGALHRMRADGAGEEELRRFRMALRGPLGALGDALVWVGWLPAALLVAGITFLVGAPPLVAVGLFLVLHNVLHLWLRWWGVGVGLGEGRGVGPALQRANLGTMGSRVRTVGIVLTGIFAGVLGVMGVGALEQPAPFLVGAGALLALGMHRGMSLPGALPGLVALMLLAAGGFLAF